MIFPETVKIVIKTTEVETLRTIAYLRFSVRSRIGLKFPRYKLANDGQDTRAIQHYLGHRNIQHTTRYTDLASDRFKDFWRD